MTHKVHFGLVAKWQGSNDFVSSMKDQDVMMQCTLVSKVMWTSSDNCKSLFLYFVSSLTRFPSFFYLKHLRFVLFFGSFRLFVIKYWNPSFVQFFGLVRSPRRNIYNEQFAPQIEVWNRETRNYTKWPLTITTWFQSNHLQRRQKLLWILQKNSKETNIRSSPISDTEKIKDKLHS